VKKRILLLSIIAIIFVVGCGSPPKEITDTARDMAINSITQHEEVRDAAVEQKGADVSLVIIVDYSTSPDRARQLGDNFVRLVKTFSEDESPQKEVGTGIYNYLVGVYYPNIEEVVLGAKDKTSPHITW